MKLFSSNILINTADTTPPVINGIDDITVVIELGTATVSQVTWVEPTATDNSGTVTLVSRTHTPNAFFTIGTTPVTYTFSDPSGNTASTTFNVNVVTGELTEMR